MDTEQKLQILTDAAKYDVACTSSGVDRAAEKGKLGSTSFAGICHSFSADGRCITLLKVLMTNVCAFDCAYCANRRSNDIPRASFDPRELAQLTVQFYRRNYIEGLFLSSGIVKSPDFTMERMMQCVQILRDEHDFLGYIHVKAIPGTSPELMQQLGYMVDRMSVNIELPSKNSLSLLAPGKSKQSILEPMGLLASGIREHGTGTPRHRKPLAGGSAEAIQKAGKSGGQAFDGGLTPALGRNECIEMQRYENKQRFVPAGQSTQLIIGATPESDLQILNLSSALYKEFALKRVFFSAYLPINDLPILPDKSVEVPQNREHRLYQADWLMRYYQFDAAELVDAQHPFLDTSLDPKVVWALRNIHLFPIEINTAPYEMLLRIPGLGVTGARRVMRARKHGSITPDSMQKMGLSLKKVGLFATFGGKYVSPVPFDASAMKRELLRQSSPSRKNKRSGGNLQTAGQLSLFDPNQVEGLEQSDVQLGEDGVTNESPFQQGQLQAFANQKLMLAKMAAQHSARREVIRLGGQGLMRAGGAL